MQPRAISRSSGFAPGPSDCAVSKSFGWRDVRMALLAQERHRRHEQRVLVRAVRRVAVEAAVAHRRVLEQERSALLGVALVAVLVDGVGLEQRRRESSRAGCGSRRSDIWPSGSGMCERRLNCRRMSLMAGGARLADGSPSHEPFRGELGHRVVAVAARDVEALMNGAEPVIARPVRVTCETAAGLHLDRSA